MSTFQPPRSEFCLPQPAGIGCDHQRALATAFSDLLDLFQRVLKEAPRSFADAYVYGTTSENAVHRNVITKLQEVHFVMQGAIARGYEGR